jgi:flagellar biosynthesis/type III secretory pathway protein FliH
MKLFTLIEKESLHSNGEKIIPKQSFSKLVKATEIIEEAEKQTETKFDETYAECEKIKMEAYQKGFQEGLNRFSEHLVLLEQKLRKMQHEMQQSMLPLTLKAVKKIVGEQIRLHSETIVDIVLKAIKTVSQCEFVKILVNKNDLDTLEHNRSKINDVLEHVNTLRIEEGKDLEEGDCIIETEKGILNAKLSHLYGSLERAFDAHSG